MRRPARLLVLSCAASLAAIPLATVGQQAALAQDDAVAQQGDGESPEVSDEAGEAAEDEPDTAATTEEALPPVMDLAVLTRHAERSYPGVRAADARIRAARAQLDEAWVSPFFQGQVTAGFTLAPEATGSPIFSPDDQVPLTNPWQPVVGFGIEGVIPVWTFGKLGAAREAARAGIHAAEADRARTRAQLVFDVRRAYFSLQLALDLQQMLSEGLPRLRDAITDLEERLAAGDPEADEVDRYRLAAALAEIEGREAQAVHLEQSARAALRILTGVRRFRVPECPISAVEVDLQDLDHYVATALGDRPEVHMLDAARRAREASLDFHRAGFLPDIGLSYRFATSYAPGITDQTNPFIIDPANYMNIGAGLVMRWSLDLWGNAYRVDRESALLDDVVARSDEARRGMELEVTDAYQTVVEARTRVASYDRGRRETRRWFIAAAQGVELGTSELDDMVDAVGAYFTARFQHLSAIHDLNTALARLERTAATRIAERWEPACD